MIPEEAVEAAAEGVLDAAFGQELPESPIDLARAALEAALPAIEKALRTQIANEISDAAITLTSGSIAEVARSVQRQAARVAEKGTTK